MQALEGTAWIKCVKISSCIKYKNLGGKFVFYVDVRVAG